MFCRCLNNDNKHLRHHSIDVIEFILISVNFYSRVNKKNCGGGFLLFVTTFIITRFFFFFKKIFFFFFSLLFYAAVCLFLKNLAFVRKLLSLEWPVQKENWIRERFRKNHCQELIPKGSGTPSIWLKSNNNNNNNVCFFF